MKMRVVLHFSQTRRNDTRTRPDRKNKHRVINEREGERRRKRMAHVVCPSTKNVQIRETERTKRNDKMCALVLGDFMLLLCFLAATTAAVVVILNTRTRTQLLVTYIFRVEQHTKTRNNKCKRSKKRFWIHVLKSTQMHVTTYLLRCVALLLQNTFASQSINK